MYIAGATYSSESIAESGYQNDFSGVGYDAFLVKFNDSGVRSWGTYYGGPGIYDEGWSCAVDGMGNVYLAGNIDTTSVMEMNGQQTVYGGDLIDGFLVKFGENINTGSTEPHKSAVMAIFPNPTNGQFTLDLELQGPTTVRVIDASGKTIHSEVLQANSARAACVVDLSSRAKGTYAIQVQNNGGSVTQTVVVE